MTTKTLELNVLPRYRDSTILVVDDDPTSLGVLSNYLKEFGFRVIVARDGESALEKAAYGKPDLILLDLLMPKLNGFETCRLMKAREDLQDIPVIFMTGLTETDDKIKGFQAGAVDYIIKPFQYEEVLARIKTHLQLHMALKQLEIQNAELQQQIHEREQADEKLRQKRQELGEAQRLANVGNWVREFEPDVSIWSEQLYNMFGCDPTLPPPDFREFHPYFTVESWNRLKIAAEELEQTGKPYELDLEIIRTDGQHGWIIARGEEQRDANGRVIKLRGTAQDITERKRAEEALQKAHDTLEQRVEERTAELKVANDQLQQTNRLLHILSDCNQQVVHAADEDELLRQICSIIVGPGGYPAVWIGFAEYDPAKTCTPGCSERT